MNRGLIITHTHTLANGLRVYSCALWDSGSANVRSVLAVDPTDCVSLYKPESFGVTWLSGPAATPRLAKKFGLKYRKRAPGAGRPKTPDESKSVYVPVWMTPAGRDRLDFIRGKRPRGVFIEQHLSLMK